MLINDTMHSPIYQTNAGLHPRATITHDLLTYGYDRTQVKSQETIYSLG